jgi:hypothetical protein
MARWARGRGASLRPALWRCWLGGAAAARWPCLWCRSPPAGFCCSRARQTAAAAQRRRRCWRAACPPLQMGPDHPPCFPALVASPWAPRGCCMWRIMEMRGCGGWRWRAQRQRAPVPRPAPPPRPRPRPAARCPGSARCKIATMTSALQSWAPRAGRTAPAAPLPSMAAGTCSPCRSTPAPRRLARRRATPPLQQASARGAARGASASTPSARARPTRAMAPSLPRA